MINKIKKCFFWAGVFYSMGGHVSFALNCPAPMDFVMHIPSPPYSYHHQQNQVEIAAISISNKMVYGSDGQWVMVTKSILANPEENHDVLVSNIVNRLENVNTMAYHSNIRVKNTAIHYCLYHLPGSTTTENFSAIAYFVPKQNAANYQSLNQLIQTIAQ